MTYNLKHLVQPSGCDPVFGPIQDDEALLLFAVCRTIGAKRVAEIGFLCGYSAINFLSAVGTDGIVYSVDLSPFKTVAPNHIALIKACSDITPEDLDNKPIDLIFLDCHSYDQLDICISLHSSGIILDSTIIALHDTGLHSEEYVKKSTRCGGGFIHQQVERDISNRLHELGWSAIHFHGLHGLKVRHGLTLMQKSPVLVNDV
jgi:hypothetical protein